MSVRVAGLQGQQVGLGLEAAGEPGQLAGRADDAMQGATMAMGFRPFAAPTARVALGFPIWRAICA